MLKVKLWGVRGSLPAPHTPEYLKAKIADVLRRFVEAQKSRPTINAEDFLEGLEPWLVSGFGGHTACIEVSSDNHSVIIDGGSGIRRLGEKLTLGSCGLGRGTVHILMTHFHWDHLIGLPFFVPLFIPGNTIHFYAVQEDLEQRIRSLFCKPLFPVPFESLGSKIHFHKLQPRQEQSFGDLKVTPYQLDHPDPCWGYRIECNGKVFSHCVDSEGTRVSQKDLGPDLPLYQNVDLMTFDAQYTFVEATEKINWGHSSAPIGLDIAMRERVKRVLFIHHDPAASDEKIAKAEAQTSDYYESCKKTAKAQKRDWFDVEWGFAREGMVIELK